MSQPVADRLTKTNDNSLHIALGGNVTSRIGPPENTLRAALQLLESDSFQIEQISPFYATPAFPKGSGPDFVNAVARARTPLDAAATLAHLHAVEAEIGRARPSRWAPRTIDLDLISFGDEILPDRATFELWRTLPLAEQQARAPDGLILPHPRLQDRAFVLGPFCDVSPNWLHPVLGQTAHALFARLPAEDRASLRRLPPA